MDAYDEDTDWLVACAAVADEVPAANLPHTTFPGSSSTRGNRTTADRPMQSASDRSRITVHPERSSYHHSRRGGLIPNTPQSCSGNGMVPTSTLRCVRNPQGTQQRTHGRSNSGTANQTARGGRNSFRPHASAGRYGSIRGVGAHPDEDLKPRQREDDAGDPVDPCWRCGEPVIAKNFGGVSFFACSGHPLCKAKRTSRKNGAVIELVAEKITPRAAQSDGASPAHTPEDDDEHAGGISRCHLAVTVRGGHREGGAAARRTWDLLRRNGIVPDTRQTGDRGASLKAVLDLSKREFVRRLAKSEMVPYRDIPQTTYSRLAASEAGVAVGTAAGNGSMGIQKATPRHARRLEPITHCESLVYTLPAGLRDTLLPFQREGVMYGLRRRGRLLIADEMGTGKTLQALAVMACYKSDWPLLIVAPASMRLMWAEEVERWYPFLAPEDLHLIRGNKDKLYLKGLDRHLWPRVTIVSYFMLRMLSESIGKDDWNAVIFDESHTISTKLGDESAQSQQVNVCLGVVAKATRAVLLSGTPSLSKPFDLFNQVEALSPGLLGRPPSHTAKYDFASNYCQGARREQTSRGGNVVHVPFISGCEYADELNLLLTNEVMIRRLKANVVDQLPPLRRIVVRVAEHSENLKRALEEGGYDDNTDGGSEEAHQDPGSRASGGSGWRAGLRLMSDDQQAGLKKVRSASEWIVDKLSASEETKTKVVVFAHHKIVLDRLQESLEIAGMPRKGQSATASASNGGDADNSGFGCLRIDGEVPTALRASRLNEFNKNDHCRVLLVSITAGGQGLDFTAASNVVFVELPESPAWLRQAEDRLHRRRQVKSVNVYFTVLPPGSHDDMRWLHLSEKLTAQSSVVNGTADAENMDVHRVFEAGGLADGEDHYKHFCGNNHTFEQDSDHASDDDEGNGDGDGDVNEPEPMKEGLDAEVAAMLLTPVSVDTHSASQSPTLKLLRAIAKSPAGLKPETPAKGRSTSNGEEKATGMTKDQKTKTKTMEDFFSSQESTTSMERNRAVRSSGVEATRRRNYVAADRSKETRRNVDATAAARSGATATHPCSGDADPSGEVCLVHEPARQSAGGTRDKGFPVKSPSRKRSRAAITSSPISACNLGGTLKAKYPSTGFSTVSPSAHGGKRRSSTSMFMSWGEWERATPPPPPQRRSASASSRACRASIDAPVSTACRFMSASRSAASPAASSAVETAATGAVSTAASNRSGMECVRTGVQGDSDGDDALCDEKEQEEEEGRHEDEDGQEHEEEIGGNSVGDRRSEGDKELSTSSPPEVVDLSAIEEEENEPATDPLMSDKINDSHTEDVPVDAHVDLYDDSRADFNGDDPLDLYNAFDDGENIDHPAAPANISGACGASGEATSAAIRESDRGRGSGVDCGGTASPALSSQLLSQRRRADEERRKGEEDARLASKLLFEVSDNTGRVHVYRAQRGGANDGDGMLDTLGADGEEDEDRRPVHCRCNFRPEDLDRLFEVARSWSDGGDAAKVQALTRDALRTLPEILRSAPALSVAGEFVKDWRELPARKRPLLKGRPSRPPLNEVARRYTPKLAGSTQRYSDRTNGGAKGAKDDCRRESVTRSLPSSALPSSLGKELNADSSLPTEVLCLFCPELASVQGRPVHRRDRFCSARCMEAHGSRSAGSSLRRLVSDRDGGVCSNESCGRDCQALVSRLKAVESLQKRRDIVTAADPRFEEDKYRTAREKLVRQPREGNAWHADHVTAVYEGGGECGVDNLRTLCVICHAEVTRKQAAERAAARASARAANGTKSLQVKHIPGQRRLVSFGGGITLSQGSTGSRQASPSDADRNPIEVDLDPDLPENGASDSGDVNDCGSSDEEGLISESRTKGTKGAKWRASAGEPGSNRTTSGHDNSSACRRQSYVARACSVGVAKGGSVRPPSPEQGTDSRDVFERLVSGADLFATGGGGSATLNGVGNVDLAKGICNGGGGKDVGRREESAFPLTRVQRMSRPKKSVAESSGTVRDSICLDIHSSSSDDSDK